MVTWEIKGREFGNCNCNYGCPCQFNALPTHGHCRGLAVFDIEQGFHGTTRLDGLRSASIFRWPGPIHEGKGEGWHIVDRRATPKQREALLRILRGEDTEPGATVYQVFSSTCDTFHEHAVADFESMLRRDGAVVLAALVLLSLLAWLAVLAGAGTGMDPAAMSGWWLPGAAAPAFVSDWTPAFLLIAFFMWAAMMVAMMLPSASPMVLLYARVARQAQSRGQSQAHRLLLQRLLAAISPCGFFSALWPSPFSGCSNVPERCRC